MGEVNIYGVFVPTFLIQAILAYILLRIVNLATDKWVIHGWIALPSIFNLCLYLILLYGIHWLFIVV